MTWGAVFGLVVTGHGVSQTMPSATTTP